MNVDSEKIKSSFFYFIGMGSLVAADLFIVKYYPDSFIAEWAFLKSLLFIGGSVVVFGLDQMFIRHSLKVSVYFPKFLKHVVLFSTGFAVILYYRDSNIFVIFVIILFSINQLLFGSARANFHYKLSQILSQSWKVLLLLILLLVHFVPIIINIYLFVIISLFTPLLLNIKTISKLMVEGKNSNEKMSIIYQDAFLMFLSIITLNIAIYADQLFLKEFALKQDAIKLFAHTSSIYPVGIAINGLAGFFLGPFFKKRPDFSLKKVGIILFFVAIILSISSFFFGVLVLKFIKHVTFDIKLGIFLSIIIAFRIIYILPSSYIGVIGSRRMLKSFVLICILGVLVQIFSFLTLIKFTTVNIIYAAVISVIAHWLIRSLGGILNIYYLKPTKDIC